MEPENLTVHILREIRDDIRAQGEESRAHGVELRAQGVELRAHGVELRALSGDVQEFRAHSEQRFLAIDIALRDTVEQLVMLARGVTVAIESRGQNDSRVDVLERRVDVLERRMVP